MLHCQMSKHIFLPLIVLSFVVLFVISNSPAPAWVNANVSDSASLRTRSSAPGSVGAQYTNPDPPQRTVRLVFVHHSTGNNWLHQNVGRLRQELNANNYFVTDVSYGWGPSEIGNYTDIGHWYNWFLISSRDTYLSALYATSENSHYNSGVTDPGGENEIIMFKSCFPNSDLLGNPDDPPTTGDNPLRGQPARTPSHTVANAKGIYNDLLAYFQTRQDKLFIVITAPPLVEAHTTFTYAQNARAFNDWLVNDWLVNYSYHNVAVFDFYNVLTSNGGDPNTHDYGWITGNHHRVTSFEPYSIQHITDQGSNYAQYGRDTDDSHPTVAGYEKAREEFVPMLNVFYNLWKLDLPWKAYLPYVEK